MKTKIALLALSLLATPSAAQMGGGGGWGGGGGGMGGHHRGSGGGMGAGMGGPGGGYHEHRPIKPIKWSEFEAKLREAFAAADLDHNGVVTIDEVHAARDAKLKRLVDERFAMIDTNHDGAISRDEFAAWQLHMGDPDQADQKMAAEDRQQIADASGKAFRRHGDDDEVAGGLLAPVDEVLIVNADSNNDLALSLAEDLAWQKARFDAADTDHDGTLSEDEIRAARQKTGRPQG
jgi:Ca2+-binding EF-hand superfamily protein